MSDPMTEAAEMYLLRIALLAQDQEPVPISRLADALDVSPISANQMCRKLETRGLVTYQPYKGVTLTPKGKHIALQVLRKRRLWEVFLVSKLGIDPQEAEEIACRLEHVTPQALGERLAEYLGQPTLSPQQQPIPPQQGEFPQQVLRPLTTLAVGQRARVIHILADETLKRFLQMHHLIPGAEIQLLAQAGDQALILKVADQHLTLSTDVAQNIDIVPLETS